MEHTTYASYYALQVADGDRLPADGTRRLWKSRGTELMHKVMFCCRTAPLSAPIPRFVSTAAAQQQMATSNKNAKTKKEPSVGQLALRERQKKYAAEWKEAKAAGKI